MEVYKYSLGSGQTWMNLPKGAEIVHFGMQHETLHLWALVDLDQPFEPREIVIAATGQTLPLRSRGRWKHVGTTFTDQEGTYVFHLFEAVAED